MKTWQWVAAALLSILLVLLGRISVVSPEYATPEKLEKVSQIATQNALAIQQFKSQLESVRDKFNRFFVEFDRLTDKLDKHFEQRNK